MRKLLVVAAFAALSVTANASVEFALRGDYVGTGTYNDPNNVTQSGSSYFDAQYARVFYKGKLTDTASGIIVMDFLQTSTALGAGANFFKVAELDNKIGDMFEIGMGRLLDAGIGGFEGVTPFYDLWSESASFIANFPMGAKFDINFTPTQQLRLLALNQNWDQGSVAGALAFSTGNSSLNNSQPATTGSATNSNTSLGYGARWRADWTPYYSTIISYHVNPTSGDAVAGSSSSSVNQYVVVGAQYKGNGLTAAFDYMNYTFGGIGTNAKDNGFKTTADLIVKYDIGQWTPRLKAELSTVQDVPSLYFLQNGNSAAGNFYGYNGTSFLTSGYTDQITRIDVGTDYRVSDAGPFYYSAHYISSTNQFSNTPAAFKNQSINESAVYLSMIGKFDVLK